MHREAGHMRLVSEKTFFERVRWPKAPRFAANYIFACVPCSKRLLCRFFLSARWPQAPLFVKKMFWACEVAVSTFLINKSTFSGHWGMWLQAPFLPKNWSCYVWGGRKRLLLYFFCRLEPFSSNICFSAHVRHIRRKVCAFNKNWVRCT